MRWSWFVREKTGSWKGKGDCHAAVWKWGRIQWQARHRLFRTETKSSTTSNKSGSSLLPKNMDCRVQNWVQTLFVCFNQVNLSVLLIPCFTYVFAHLLHFDVCFSDFGHFILSEGIMHVLEDSALFYICTPVYSWMVEKNHDDCQDGLNLLPIFDFLFAM